MSAESRESENFRQVRRALVLKRYEQPPPRYFNEFSGQVIARLQAGERGQGQEAGSWFRGIWAFLDTRPAVAASFGMAMVAVVIFGVVCSDRGSEPVALMPGDHLTAGVVRLLPPIAAQQTDFQAGTNELTDSLFRAAGPPALIPMRVSALGN